VTGREATPTPGPQAWRRVAFGMFAVGWGANQFSSMLVAYKHELHFGAGTLAALFGVYALGLVPGLLLGGPASDRYGRRPLTIAFVALSPLATFGLVLGRHGAEGLALARLLAGACSGVVFAAGSAWVQELSAGTPEGTGARRAAIALTAGFGTGPVVTGLMAQWVGHPLVVPYVPHIVLGLAALVLLPAAPETTTGGSGRVQLRLSRAVRTARFGRVVAPTAPWVFGCAAIAIAVLPGRVGHVSVGLTGVICGLTLGTGVAVQPFARRLEDRIPLRAGRYGLVAAVTGTLIGVAAVDGQHLALVVLAAFPLGAGYGLCLVSGLRESERLTAPDERGATLAVYYALTYVGFAVPYLLAALSHLTGDAGALAVAAGGAALTAAAGQAAQRRAA
jgi:MFS family permease